MAVFKYKPVTSWGKKFLSEIETVKQLYLEGQSNRTISRKYAPKETLKKTTGSNTTVERVISALKKEGVYNPKTGRVVKITNEELGKRPDLTGARITETGEIQLPYLRNPEISARIEAGAKGNVHFNQWLRDNPDLSKPSVQKFIKEKGIKWQAQGSPGKLKESVTKNILDIEKLIKNNPGLSAKELQAKSGLNTYTFNNRLTQLKTAYKEGRAGFEADKELEAIIESMPSNIMKPMEEKILEVLDDLEIDQDMLSDESLKSLMKSRIALLEFFRGGEKATGIKGTHFEHRFPKVLVKEFKGDPDLQLKLLLTGSRTTPELNYFKSRYDNILRGAVTKYKEGDISLNEYNKIVNQARKEVRDVTGGYEIGYIKYDKSGKATPVVEGPSVLQKGGEGYFGPQTTQIASAFKNLKYHNNLVKNYKKDPDNPIFNKLRIKSKPENISEYSNLESAFSKVAPHLNISRKKFTEFAAKNINNPVIKALFKKPAGKASLVTAATLTPTALVAEEKTNNELAQDLKVLMDTSETEYSPINNVTEQTDIEFGDPETWDKKVLDFVKEYPVVSGTAAGTTAVGGALATKTGRKALGKIAQVGLSTPPGMVGLNLALGVDPTSTMDRTLLEAELAAAPGLVKGAEAVTKNPLMRKLLTLGISPRVAAGLSGLGITALAGEGLYELGKRGVAEYEKLQAMTPEEKEAYLAEEVYPLMDEGAMVDISREGFADGSKPPKMDRRLFLKIMGGIMSLPILGKMSKVAKPAAGALSKEVQSLNIPTHFTNLVQKIRTFGKMFEGPKSRSERYRYGDYEMDIDADTGQIEITKQKMGVFGDEDGIVSEEYMTFKPGRADETTGGKTPPDEYEEYTAYADQDGKMTDVEEGVLEDTIEEGLNFKIGKE